MAVKRKKNKKLYVAAKALHNFELQVGFFDKYADGTPIGGIAAVQNFGAVINRGDYSIIIPARPFMSLAYNNHKAHWAGIVAKEMNQKLLKENHKDASKAVAEELAFHVETAIENQIEMMNYPPNAESTLRQKDGSKPLVDTGEMLNSITHKVKKK